MRWLVLIAAFVIAVVGCSSTAPRAATSGGAARAVTASLIHGDTRFHASERQTAIVAAKRIAELTGGRFKISFTWDFDETSLLSLAEEPHMIRVPKELAPAHCGGDATDAIRIVPETCTDLLACMMHEIAHYVLGMQHPEYSAPHSVMRPKNPGHVWTATDRAECRRVGACAEPRIVRDETTVTVFVDPAIPPVEPEYPKWPTNSP